MKGYRDTMQPGAHTVRLDGVPLSFDAEGVLWNPPPEQEDVLTKDSTRQARFEPVAPLGKSPVEQEFVAGAALFEPSADDATGEAKAERPARRRQG